MSEVVARTFREERAIVLATLIRQAGDFQLAEDAVQAAFSEAVTVWERDGVPADPGTLCGCVMAGPGDRSRQAQARGRSLPGAVR